MSPRSRLLVALLSTALIGYVALGSLLGRVLGDTSYGQLAIFNEVVRLVLEAYVEPVNLDRATPWTETAATSTPRSSGSTSSRPTRWTPTSGPCSPAASLS
jgi:hypothetical protein